MPNVTEPELGEVWTVWLDEGVGHEQAGVRPALIVSTEAYNTVPHGLRLIVPITSRNRGLPLHVPVDPPEGGLTRPSVILCEQLAAQSVARFRRKRGEVTPETLAVVQEMIAMFLLSE